MTITATRNLTEIFAPVIAQIAAGAVERERTRALPFAEVRALRDAGFGALRVPVEFGGWGVSLEELFRLLIELGEADSNLPQLLRGHIAFVETQLALPDSPQRTAWFTAIANGDILFGNAQAEAGTTSTNSTVLERREGRLLLNGRKFYSTGTLYGDWIWSAARHVFEDGQEQQVALAVRADADGVTRIDDWDGFGQRLTGSGTTVFENVEIDPAHILPWTDSDGNRSLAYTQGLYQLVLLASLTGIARAVRRDAVAFVQPRTRTFGIPGNSSPRDEPLVQRVVGKLASIAFSVEATALEAVRRLEHADLNRTNDEADDARYYTALVSVFEAQHSVIAQVLEATSLLFEVGGASAVGVDLALDRHWRNARTIASHNPATYREKSVGEFYLNGTLPKSQLHLVNNEKRLRGE